MQFSRKGTIYRVARITGPKHNLLGIEFQNSSDLVEPIVEALPAEQTSGVMLNAEEVASQVLAGISQANEGLGMSFKAIRIQYVPSDSGPVDVYRFLAAAIVEHMYQDNARP